MANLNVSFIGCKRKTHITLKKKTTKATLFSTVSLLFTLFTADKFLDYFIMTEHILMTLVCLIQSDFTE